MSEDCAPIACSLEAGEFTARVAEWRALVASSVQALESDATAVHMVLAPTPDALLRAAELGQREKACCAFFDVSIDLAAAARTLTLRVPEGSEEVLATFVAMLTA